MKPIKAWALIDRKSGKIYTEDGVGQLEIYATKAELEEMIVCSESEAVIRVEIREVEK